jgi:mono/diheme cytochrome c family protein
MREVLWQVVVPAIVLVTSCGPERVGEPFGPPLRPLSPMAQQGQLVFIANCEECHPGGASGLAPAINDKPLPPFLMRFQVRHGLGAMPSFNEQMISDEDLDALLVYLLETRRLGRQEDQARSSG